MDITIYHNPRCSKSRQTLALIKDAGYTPNIIKYLETPLEAKEISDLVSLLGFDTPRDVMRTGEAIYKDLGLKNIDNPQQLIQAMVKNPKLIERPIVVRGQQAVLGRPPENVNKLL